MNYLEERLKIYMRDAKKIRKLKSVSRPRGISVGDVVCLYGDNGPIYAVVIDDDKETKNCVVLTPELILSGEGLLVRVNHLVSLLRVTPLNFYLTRDMEKYCEVVGKVDVERIAESYRKLKEKAYRGVRKRFYRYEVKRIEIVYNMFLEFLNEFEEKASDSIVLEWDEINHLFDKKDLETVFVDVAVAQGAGVDLSKFLVVAIENGVKIVFADELIGKVGRVLLAGKTIYSGRIPLQLQIDFHRPVSIEAIVKILDVQIEETQEG